MTINEHETVFLGEHIHEFDVERGVNIQHKVVRIALDYDQYGDGQTVEALLRALCDDPNAGKVEGLVIGAFSFDGDDSGEIVETLIECAPQLKSLRGLFIGDITYDENEISWIENVNMGPLLAAYPKLETFRVRGSNGLSFGEIDHAKLRAFIVESGGLPSAIVDEVLTAKLPALEHLELWLGSESYGWDGSIELFETLFEKCPFPKLRHLGLRDAEIADEIAIAIAGAPIMGQLKSLDLSLGVLSDHGVEALLASDKFKTLERFDYHHHYVTQAVMDRLRQLKMEIDDSDARNADGNSDDDDMYVAVSE